MMNKKHKLNKNSTAGNMDVKETITYLGEKREEKGSSWNIRWLWSAWRCKKCATRAEQGPRPCFRLGTATAQREIEKTAVHGRESLQ